MHAFLGIFRHATQFFIVLFPERLFAPFCKNYPGLIHKRVDIDVEKHAQISIVAKKTNTKITPDYNCGTQTSCTLQLFFYFFVIIFVLCYWYNKKQGLHLPLVIILFKIEFVHAQISISTVSTPPNYAKLYFDAKFLEKGLNREERGWVKFLWLFF